MALPKDREIIKSDCEPLSHDNNVFLHAAGLLPGVKLKCTNGYTDLLFYILFCRQMTHIRSKVQSLNLRNRLGSTSHGVAKEWQRGLASSIVGFLLTIFFHITMNTHTHTHTPVHTRIHTPRRTQTHTASIHTHLMHTCMWHFRFFCIFERFWRAHFVPWI